MSALDDIRQRAEEATEGPWEVSDANEGEWPPRPLWVITNDAFHNPGDDDDSPWLAVELHTGIKEDAEFIAHSRTDIPRLLGALDAVLALHKPVEVFEYDDMNGVFKLDADGEQILMATFCTGCTPDDALESIGDCEYDAGVFNGEVSWPCPTVAAVNDALEADK